MDATAQRAKTVLIVDDFDDNRQMYAEFLTYSGYRILEATNGAEAVAKAQELLPDVVVMDISLPVLDGLEATRRLKSDPRTGNIPVIALTGHTSDQDSQIAREAGCDAFLAKPCLPDHLLETIQELLARSSRSVANGATPSSRST
jgi:CheY-like chemotaxis protein